MTYRTAAQLLLVTGCLIGFTGAGLTASGAAPWGRHGHRLVGAAAVGSLPGEMPEFFRRAAPQLTYLNYEPDRWRDDEEFALDRAMGTAYSPEHYVDFEGVPSDAFDAVNRYDFIEALRASELEETSVGFLPYRLLELAQLLRSDFRRWRQADDPDTRRWLEQRIINDAGILGHYVADGSNPHHTSIHHHGWVGANPNGYSTDNTIHSRFESRYVEAQVDLDDLLPHVPETTQVHWDFRTTILAYLRTSHTCVERLYELEKIEPFGPGVTRAEHREFVVGRLVAGTQMLRDLWWSAWVTSASED